MRQSCGPSVVQKGWRRDVQPTAVELKTDRRGRLFAERFLHVDRKLAGQERNVRSAAARAMAETSGTSFSRKSASTRATFEVTTSGS